MVKTCDDDYDDNEDDTKYISSNRWMCPPRCHYLWIKVGFLPPLVVWVGHRWRPLSRRRRTASHHWDVAEILIIAIKIRSH